MSDGTGSPLRRARASRWTEEELVVRRSSQDDFAFMLRLGERAFMDYANDPGRTMRSLLDTPDSEAHVVEAGETKLGFVLVSFARHEGDFGPWQRPVVARLDAIAVRSDSRGRGVGRVLLARVEGLARARQAVSISLTTATTNVRARRLFASSGFVVVAPLPDTYSGGQDAVAMMKLLCT